MRLLNVRKDLRSTNFSPRDAEVSLLVLHYTGMQSGEAAIVRLCQESAKVSAHYVVDEDGSMYSLVDEEHCAWHAGVSFWRGHKNVNNISIGIEMVNPGHEWGYRPFPEIQMQAVAALCADIMSRHAISARNIVAHSDVAPQRKEDPGELFDWQWLAKQGIGLWPEIEKHTTETGNLQLGDTGDGVLQLQLNLATYGYEVPQNGIFDAATKKVAIAFQRHFRPADISGKWDKECQEILAALLAML